MTHAQVKLGEGNFDQKIGVQIIQNALRVPMKTIASNAGVEGAVVVGKVGGWAACSVDGLTTWHSW